MENWEHSYDSMLANPPEPPESRCKCFRCEEELFPDDAYYTLDGEIYCGYCAEKWLETHKNWVSEWMAYGEE